MAERTDAVIRAAMTRGGYEALKDGELWCFDFQGKVREVFSTKEAAYQFLLEVKLAVLEIAQEAGVDVLDEEDFAVNRRSIRERWRSAKRHAEMLMVVHGDCVFCEDCSRALELGAGAYVTHEGGYYCSQCTAPEPLSECDECGCHIEPGDEFMGAFGGIYCPDCSRDLDEEVANG